MQCSSPTPKRKNLGNWKLSDGREVPAVIDHETAQRELKHAQTPGVGQVPFTRVRPC